MSKFQRLVIRALLILIRQTYGPVHPKDSSFEERMALMDAKWAKDWPLIQAFEADAEQALNEETET